ncbi:MAG: MarR family transcriptional regulator [Propionibacteriaceae bacterium]|nr:MarR family transcriptional regulator [Propionibacteriaceae bacterium]
MPDRDPLLILASEIRLACQHVSRRVRYDNCHEIPPHQFSVLAKLSHGPKTPGELARIEEVSAPSMTRTVNGLVEQGLVARNADPDDGRRQHLELTESGREMIERTRASRDDWMVRRLQGLPEADLAVLREATDILKKVIHV